jgi:DNA replication and repair protein RecF
MKILNARLHHFRNHIESAFEFGIQMNVLLGENGQGKTNALEALSFFCLTKSFYAGADTVAVQQGKTVFEVEGILESDNGKSFAVRVAFDAAQKEKRFTINGAGVERLSSVIGMFPVVILSPENNAITFGAPSDRRKFIDLVMSQSSAAYMEDLIEYRRVVRQRNRILSEETGSRCEELLAPWNEVLTIHGSAIIAKRKNFVREFAPFIAETYKQIAGNKETPAIDYAATVNLDPDATVDAIRTEMEKKLRRRFADEQRFKTTLVGPHRDEIAFSLNGMPMKQYASQGQHKTFLVALKVAEFFYLKDRCNETPVFLLDDVFSELDEKRSQQLMSLVSSLGQTFITATGEAIFGGAKWNNERKKFMIHNGSVVAEKIAA